MKRSHVLIGLCLLLLILNSACSNVVSEELQTHNEIKNESSIEGDLVEHARNINHVRDGIDNKVLQIINKDESNLLTVSQLREGAQLTDYQTQLLTNSSDKLYEELEMRMPKVGTIFKNNKPDWITENDDSVVVDGTIYLKNEPKDLILLSNYIRNSKGLGSVSIDDSRGLYVYNTKVWPKGEIPVIFVNLNGEQKNKVRDAFRSWEAKSGGAVKFYECTTDAPGLNAHTPFPRNAVVSIRINNDIRGDGQATIGYYRHGKVEFRSNFSSRTALHELGHVIGLRHEHQRRDRDDYIQVNWVGNGDWWDQWYQKILDNQWPTRLYDYMSIMHYKNGQITNGKGITMWRFEKKDPWIRNPHYDSTAKIIENWDQTQENLKYFRRKMEIEREYNRRLQTDPRGASIYLAHAMRNLHEPICPTLPDEYLFRPYIETGGNTLTGYDGITVREVYRSFANGRPRSGSIVYWVRRYPWVFE